MFKRKLNIVVSCILAVFLAFFCLTPQSVLAEQNTVEYTDVLTDLSQDKTFNLNDYPANGKDNTLSVINVAESENKELFVYVHQPSAFARNLIAEEIRLAMPSIGQDAVYKDYKLTLLSQNGVLQKYKVDGVTVKADSVRYYFITQITRSFDSTIDTVPSNGNTASNVVFDVSQKWEFSTINGNVAVRMLELETIVITDKFVGFIRYDNGFKFYTDKCDSHFVAFSTDKQIDTLLEASITYVNQSLIYQLDEFTGDAYSYVYGEKEVVPIELKNDQEASNEANGLFGTKYTWKRIEKVQDFLNNEDSKTMTLTKEGSIELNKMKWVLRFVETPFTIDGHLVRQTHVSDVTILRLKFETEGETYNLGVVDNKQTGSKEPVGTVGDSLTDSLKLLLKLVVLGIGIVLVISLILPFVPWIIKIVADVAVFVVKLLLWVVILPFKLIFGLFKAIFKKKE